MRLYSFMYFYVMLIFQSNINPLFAQREMFPFIFNYQTILFVP